MEFYYTFDFAVNSAEAVDVAGDDDAVANDVDDSVIHPNNHR